MGRGDHLGLSLDSFILNVVWRRQRGASETLTYASAPLHAGILDRDQIHDPRALAQAIGAACHAAGVRPGRMAVAAPASACVIRPLSLPPLQPRELREAVRWEMERFLPYPADSAIIDYCVLPDPASRADHGTSIHVLAAATPAHFAEGLREALRLAGASATILTPRPWALAAGLHLEPTGGWRLLVDVANQNTLISLLQHREIHLNRVLRRDPGEPTDSNTLSNLAQEIERSWQFAQQQHPACTDLRAILVAADPTLSADLIPLLQRRLPYPVTPISSATMPTATHPGHASLTPIDAAALGVARASTRPPLDLRSPHERHQRRINLLRPVVALLPVLTLSGLLAFGSASDRQHQALQHAVTLLELERQHHDTQRTQQRALRENLDELSTELRTLASLNHLQSNLQPAVESLAAALAASAIDSLSFDELQLTQESSRIRASLMGRARDATAVARFLSALEAQPEWTLEAPSLTQQPGEPTTSWRVRAWRTSDGTP